MSTSPSCPQCKADVTLPPGIASDAKVQCPLCNEEYLLSESLQSLPPMLIVLHVPVVEANIEEGFQLEGSSGFQFDASTSESSEGGVATAAKPTTAPKTKRRRRKKKEVNIGKEIVKIILGGVAGILITYYVLVWGFAREPLEISKNFPSWMQWSLPEQFKTKPKTETPKEDPPKENKKNSNKSKSGQKSHKPKNGKKPEDMNTDKKDDDNPDGEPKENPEKIENPIENPEDNPDLPTIVEPEEPLIEEPEIEEPLIEEPEIEVKPQVEVEPKTSLPEEKNIDPLDKQPSNDVTTLKPVEQVGLKIEKPISKKELEAITDDVLKASDNVNPQDDEKLSADNFRAYMKLCEAIDLRSRIDADVKSNAISKIDASLRTLVSSDQEIQSLGQLANVHLNRTKGKEGGVILSGSVVEISSDGNLDELKISLPAFKKFKAQTITVVMPHLKNIAKDDIIIIAGVKVNQPKQKIVGYKGKQDKVIWAAIISKIEDELPVELPEVEKSDDKPAAKDADIDEFSDEEELEPPAIEFDESDNEGTDEPSYIEVDEE